MLSIVFDTRFESCRTLCDCQRSPRRPPIWLAAPCPGSSRSHLGRSLEPYHTNDAAHSSSIGRTRLCNILSELTQRRRDFLHVAAEGAA